MGNSRPAGRRINPHYLINCLNNNESGICVSSALGCRDMSETANAAQQIQELKIPPILIFPERKQLHRVGLGPGRCSSTFWDHCPSRMVQFYLGHIIITGKLNSNSLGSLFFQDDKI